MARSSKQAAAIPNVTEVPLDVLTVGAPLGITGADGRTAIGHVQHVGQSFALATSAPDAASASGVAGMFGTVGNGAKDGKAQPGCIGHGADKVPAIGAGYLYGIVGAIPARYGSVTATGRYCESCHRAVRLDGGLFGAAPAADTATVTAEPTRKARKARKASEPVSEAIAEPVSEPVSESPAN